MTGPEEEAAGKSRAGGVRNPLPDSGILIQSSAAHLRLRFGGSQGGARKTPEECADKGRILNSEDRVLFSSYASRTEILTVLQIHHSFRELRIDREVELQNMWFEAADTYKRKRSTKN